MAKKKIEVDATLNYIEKCEERLKQYINDVLCQFYIDSIITCTPQKVQELELQNTLPEIVNTTDSVKETQ